MFCGTPISIQAGGDADTLAAQVEQLPNTPAVFVVWPREGEPYLAKTAMLRRRLKRLLLPREKQSRLLNLGSLVQRVEYWPVGSRLESSLVQYELARTFSPGTYLQLLRLRMPHYVKLILTNQFPRTHVTSRIGSARAQYFGPFSTRQGAEDFNAQFLDLFQIRRCQEDLAPHPEHPGCIYGEMNMCLRPCQQRVGIAEYASEVERVKEFLATGGRQMLLSAESARDRLSAEMNFEEAARQHTRIDRISQVLKLREGLIADIDQLHGIAVAPSLEAESVKLWFLLRGEWITPIDFSVAPPGEASLPMDRRLRETVESIAAPDRPSRLRQEHLALLARWYYSSWRDGDWVPIPALEKVPYRKLVGAISRVARANVQGS
jgi:excinuclease ABC subunit C